MRMPGRRQPWLKLDVGVLARLRMPPARETDTFREAEETESPR